MNDAAAPASYNFADLWEAVWPLVSDREALVCGPQRRTYAQLAERANRLAHHLRAAGVGPGDRIGLFLRNDAGYLEAMIAAFSLRAVPVNMNHRYTGEELGFLIADSGAVALLVHETLTGAVATVPGGVDHLRTLLVLDDPDPATVEGDRADLPGATTYEDALAASSPDPVATPGRSGDDEYLMYTGGTTGRPKGVQWRQEDAFFAASAVATPCASRARSTSPASCSSASCPPSRSCPSPLMHAAAQWTTWSWLLAGGKTVLMPGRLHGPTVWQAVVDEGVNSLTVVGDAVGRPLVEAWEAEPDRWDVANLFAISNGGAPMSPSLKTRLAELFPGRAIVDGFGSSESGVQGSQRLQAGDPITGLARFARPAHQRFDDDLRPVEPGSGVIGRVANAGRLPRGYLNDPAKTAETFVEVDGQRYCFTGDLATVEPDGTIQLLGRGSLCINTGGEKVFPEEVESVLVDHPRWPTCSWSARPTSAGQRGHRRGGAGRRRRSAEPRRPARARPRPPRRLQDPQAPRGGRPRGALARRQGRLPLGASRRHRGRRGHGRLTAAG
ncbi:MAG: AMP-binding protein [Acidimicrobiales bacterium]